MKMLNLTDRRSPLITLLAIALNLVITIPLAASLNIWTDEAYSLNTTSKPFSEAIYQALYFEIQPPFYYLCLELWRNLHDSIFVARLFSIACIALTIFVCQHLSQRYLNTIHSGWVVVLVALHPYSIWAAVEIRAYPLSVLLSALLLLFFYDGYLSSQPTVRARWIHAGVAVIALYTHYFLGSLLVAGGFCLLCLRRWRSLFTYVLFMLGVGLCFIPMLSLVIHHLSARNAVVGEISSSFPESLRAMMGRVLIYVFPIELIPRLAKVIRYGFLGFWIWLLWRHRRALTTSHVALLSVLAGTTVILALGLDVINLVTYAYRYSYPVFISAILTFVAALSLFLKPTQTKALTIWLAIALTMYAATLIATYAPLAKQGDSQRVAAWIMSQEQLNQPILVFQCEAALPLPYYYTGVNPIVPIPQPMGEDVYDPRKCILNNQAEITTAIEANSTNNQQVWLVDSTNQAEACRYLGFDFNCQVLQEFIDRYYTVEQTREFYGATVSLLRRFPAS